MASSSVASSSVTSSSAALAGRVNSLYKDSRDRLAAECTALRDELSTVRRQRDALAARLADVAREAELDVAGLTAAVEEGQALRTRDAQCQADTVAKLQREAHDAKLQLELAVSHAEQAEARRKREAHAAAEELQSAREEVAALKRRLASMHDDNTPASVEAQRRAVSADHRAAGLQQELDVLRVRVTAQDAGAMAVWKQTATELQKEKEMLFEQLKELKRESSAVPELRLAVHVLTVKLDSFREHIRALEHTLEVTGRERDEALLMAAEASPHCTSALAAPSPRAQVHG